MVSGSDSLLVRAWSDIEMAVVSDLNVKRFGTVGESRASCTVDVEWRDRLEAVRLVRPGLFCRSSSDERRRGGGEAVALVNGEGSSGGDTADGNRRYDFLLASCASSASSEGLSTLCISAASMRPLVSLIRPADHSSYSTMRPESDGIQRKSR